MWIGWKAVGLGTVSGGAIAAVLYGTLTAGSGPASASIPVAQVVPTVVYADCVAPAILEDGDCVTHVTVTRTVTPSAVPVQPAVPASPAATTSAGRRAPAPAPAPAPVSVSVTSDDGDDDHESDDHDDHDGHGDEHGDD